MPAPGTGIGSIASKASAYTVPPENLVLSPLNKRLDFGGFPRELALRVADWTVELSQDEISEIKALVELGDPDDTDSMTYLVTTLLQGEGVRTPIKGFATVQ